MKITDLHLRDLGPLRSLDLPADGMGWRGVFPDMVVIAGGNGSGKTTLLSWLATALRGLEEGVVTRTPREGRVTVETDGASFRYVAGERSWTDTFAPSNATARTVADGAERRAERAVDFAGRRQGRVVLVPSPRDLNIPATPSKMIGVVDRSAPFVHVWSRPRSWESSVEGLLYEARWRDLNAKEEGKPQVHFQRYAQAFAELVPGRALKWVDAELRVQVVGTDVVHALGELSAGEKQLLVLLADLLLYWTEGSIVLIDEPELHLHRTLQIRFAETLRRWQEARGGQLWLATQSAELFGWAPERSKVLIGAGSM